MELEEQRAANPLKRSFEALDSPQPETEPMDIDPTFVPNECVLFVVFFL